MDDFDKPVNVSFLYLKSKVQRNHEYKTCIFKTEHSYTLVKKIQLSVARRERTRQKTMEIKWREGNRVGQRLTPSHSKKNLCSSRKELLLNETKERKRKGKQKEKRQDRGVGMS